MMLPVGLIEDAVVAHAPGRVNLIGEHLDYNGGRCLPIALPYGTSATARRRRDDVRVRSGELSWSGAPGERARNEGAQGWAGYVVGVLWALGVAEPLEIEITTDLPIGAGLSSSAALECSVALAADALLGLGRDRDELVAACVRAETEYVGAPTGGLDQTTSLLATKSHALLLDFATGERRPVPFAPEMDGVSLLVVDTGVSHRLVDGGYAARRADCEEAARILGLPHLARAAPEDLDRLEGHIRRRAAHVVGEQARVDAFVAAGTDWERAGRLMTESHVSLRDDFEVSCAELDSVVDTALEAGALGARMTGGGFGGSAIVLAETALLPAIRRAVEEAYPERGWAPPRFLRGEAAPGASVVTG